MNNQFITLFLALGIIILGIYAIMYCTYKWLNSLPELIEAIKEYNKSKEELTKILKENKQ